MHDCISRPVSLFLPHSSAFDSVLDTIRRQGKEEGSWKISKNANVNVSVSGDGKTNVRRRGKKQIYLMDLWYSRGPTFGTQQSITYTLMHRCMQRSDVYTHNVDMEEESQTLVFLHPCLIVCTHLFCPSVHLCVCVRVRVCVCMCFWLPVCVDMCVCVDVC